jgi:hypothetical protein
MNFSLQFDDIEIRYIADKSILFDCLNATQIESLIENQSRIQSFEELNLTAAQKNTIRVKLMGKPSLE